MRKQVLFTLLVAAVVFGMTARLQGQTSFEAARQLYVAAEYESALQMFDRLLPDAAGAERRSIGLYRVLCLVALGRKADAERAIEAMIELDPLYRPSDEDAPPRLRAAFADARRRLLPGLIQQRYAAAKAAFDGRNFAAAKAGFDDVIAALGDPDIDQAASKPPLADLRTLAAGFRDLSARELAPPPLPTAPLVAAVPLPIAPPAAPAGPPRIYTPEDAGVIPPVVVKQEIPPYPGRVQMPVSGVLEVVVDESGSVESAAMIQKVGPQFDRLVMNAAKSWRYQPAQANGQPVKFRRRVQITLAPAP